MGGVYDDFKVIIHVLRDIAPQFCSNGLLGFAVKAGDAEIDLMLGVNDPNFGLFCWWLPLKRFPLQKVCNWRGLFPERIVECAVQLRSPINANRACRP